MALAVKLKDVVDALAMTGDLASYYLDKRTGEIIMVTDEEWEAAEEDEPISEYPDWQRDSILKAREIQGSDQFIPLPDKFEINAYDVMERFCREYPDQRISIGLLNCIKGKGAFRRFKDAVFDFDIQDEWHEFERNAFAEVAIEWLEEKGILYNHYDVIEETSEM